MKIISIDVGIKNLAYCLMDYNDENYSILEWDIIDLCNNTTINCTQNLKKKSCSKKATFHKMDDYYCNTCAKKNNFFLPCKTYLQTQKTISRKKLVEIIQTTAIQFTKDSKKEELLELIDQHCLKPIHKTSANDMNMIQLGISLKKNLDSMPSLCNVDKVLIENQVSPIANRMKTLQGMIAQYYIMKNINDIEFISASNKLKNFITTKTTYEERKKLSIKITKELLSNKELLELLEYFEKHKKKDDLADSFLQSLWYISNIK